MSYVITFEDYRPGIRYDDEPWTTIRIEEAASSTGPWTVIDTIAIDPVDTDPGAPASRSFTTEQATLEEGWYRVSFLDASGDVQATDPVRHSQVSRYFTTAEFRTRYPDIDSTNYPDEMVDEYRQLAEEAFEDAAGRAFVPRTVTENSYRRTPTDGRHLLRPDVRRILSATGSSTIDVDGLTTSNGWVTGISDTGSVSVTYEYGLDSPPLRVKQAVMALTREWMLSGPVTDRQTSIPVEGGGTISLAVPGGRFGTFGIPEVDAAVEQYAWRVFVA